MTEIDTRLGRIRGLSRTAVTAFLGIPYAAPPLADLRWSPPQPSGGWSGVLDATRPPQRSWQLPFPQTLNRGAIPGDMSEDMLYLNVWTPGADDRRRPVLVYIHGGGYSVGSANDFDPSPFVRRHDVVVVAMNYRLGLFGFLDLSRFGPHYAGSGSLGFQDQILALRWIRDNIADFGGDPGAVTLSGVSAGAGSVLALIAAPSAEGLFQRALAFSPGEIRRKPSDLFAALAAMAEQPPERYLAQLRSLGAEELFALQSKTGIAGEAAVDGGIITATAPDAIRAKGGMVPLIIGTCINEGTMLTPSVDEYNLPGLEQILDGIAEGIGDGDLGRYKAFLDALLPGAGPRERMTRLWYDYFRAPALRVVEAAQSVGAQAWLYSFEVPTDHVFGPTHASDMPFSFNLFDGEGQQDGEWLAFHRNTAVNRQLAHLWTDAFARFIRGGDPDGEGLPHWPRYRHDHRACMALRDGPVVVLDADPPAARAAYGLT